MKLDTKTITLSDGTELSIRWTWAAAQRLRKATGIDVMKDEGEIQVRAARLMDNLPALVHSILTAEDREKYSPEDFEERIAIADMLPLVEQIFEAMHPKEQTEGQQNIPFVNGAAADHLALNTSMPSEGTT